MKKKGTKQPKANFDSDTSGETVPLTKRHIVAPQPKHIPEYKEEMQLVKKQLITQIENRILNSQKRLEENLHEELETFERSISNTLNDLRETHYYAQEVKQDDGHKQMEKIFKYKRSLLSDMLKQSDYKTLYHMILASMFALMLNLWVQDYVERGIIFDIDTFKWCFSNPQTVVVVWCGMMFSSYLHVLWVHYVHKYKIRTFFAIIVHCIHQILELMIPCYLSQTQIFGFGSRMIILSEAVRFMMKSYSYARNKMLYGTANEFKNYIPPSFLKKGVTTQNAILPDISIGTLQQEIKRYTYFLYAPTLLYRDHYVKAPHYSKKKIIIEFGNFFMCIYYGFILFRTFCKQPILDLRENLTLGNFVITVFKLMMPSTACLLLLFFGLLHSWFNGWAELLRFPDRTFYQDWWTSSEFGQYYRKWNIIVHEFLYYYVYLETEKLSKGRRSRAFATLVTFGSSALIHEIILTFALGFFYPICFILFTGPGVLFIRSGKELFKKSWFNVVFWFLMYIGTSLMITLYLIEFYSRERIQDSYMIEKWGYLQYVIPRSLYLIIGV